MKDLIRLCVSRPVTVIMVIAAVFCAALFSLARLPLNRLPEILYPRVTVETRYPGMGAEDLRMAVTVPLEDALSPVKGLERIRSISRDGAAVVVLDFRWGIDPNSASVLVREAIDAVYPSLPEGVQKPLVIPGDPGEEPHAVVAIRSRTGDLAFARNFAEYELRARFRRVDGAGAVVLSGGESPEARIRVDLPRLASLGMDPAGLARVLSAETANIPAGSAREGDRELVVVSTGRPESIEELSRFFLPSGAGLRLSDLGELKQEGARRKSLFMYGGQEQAALEIYRRPGADPVRLSGDIKKVLSEAVPLFQRDLEIALVYDSSGTLLRGLGDLLLSAALGAAAVIVTLVCFIRRVRYSLLAAFSIPLSAAAALIVLGLGGKSLNGMSLGGLALGIGLVSDTAVITLDTLHRSFGGGGRRPRPDETGARAASVSASSFAGTLTTAVVFIPIIFLPGPLGALFADLSLALVSSIAAGWLYAQFGLPALYRVFFKKANSGGNSSHGGTGARGLGRLLQILCFPLCLRASVRDKKGTSRSPSRLNLERAYRRLLRAAMRRPGRVFLAAALASIGGAALLFSRPAVFVSPAAVTEIEAALLFPPGTRLEAMTEAGLEVSRALAELPGIAVLFGRAGTEDEDAGRRADPDYRRERLLFRCILREGADSEGTLGEIRRRLRGLAPPGVQLSAAYPQDRTERLLGLASSRTLAIRGNGREELDGRVRRVQAAAALVLGPEPGDFAGLGLRPAGTRPELRIIPRREAAALLGISTQDMAERLYAATEGMAAGRLETGGRPLDIRLSGAGFGSPGEGGEGGDPTVLLERVPLLALSGGPVFAGTLGTIERHEAEAALARLDRADVVYLDLPPVPGQAPGKTAAALMAAVPELSRADESVFTRYRTSLILTVFLVLALLYMTMGAQFESLSLALILMLNIPFSLAGAGPALFLSGAALDSGAVLGLIVLFGLVVNNGIVLYEISGEKRSLGFPPVKAVYAGAGDRLRPILITTLTTVFALLPLALSPRGNSQRSMALAMTGGSIAATLLSLFALPPVFIRFLKKRPQENENAE